MPLKVPIVTVSMNAIAKVKGFVMTHRIYVSNDPAQPMCCTFSDCDFASRPGQVCSGCC